MKHILADNLNVDVKKFEPRAVLSAISNAKNDLKTPAELRKDATDPFSQVVSDAYELYQEQLQNNQALDFDDLIMQTIRLFKESPENIGILSTEIPLYPCG